MGHGYAIRHDGGRRWQGFACAVPPRKNKRIQWDYAISIREDGRTEKLPRGNPDPFEYSPRPHRGRVSLLSLRTRRRPRSTLCPYTTLSRELLRLCHHPLDVVLGRR